MNLSNPKISTIFLPNPLYPILCTQSPLYLCNGNFQDNRNCKSLAIGFTESLAIGFTESLAIGFTESILSSSRLIVIQIQNWFTVDDVYTRQK